MIPPKPAPRPRRVSLWRYLRLFRQDILSAQPGHLYRAKMAVFRTPFFRSALLGDPDLIQTVLRDRPADFPKSTRIAEGLRPLLGASVFLANGAEWARQRRIIDPAFEGGRVRQSFPAMLAAARATVRRLEPGGAVEVEAAMAHATADVIFRALFSLPIDDDVAAQVFDGFRRHQRAQPILTPAAFLRLPHWAPRGHRSAVRATARDIRTLIAGLVDDRSAAIAAGTAPDDLATKIMTTPDPVTGRGFDRDEMVDQVAIFFLAGHETSASALAWTLYLLACDPPSQSRARAEALRFVADPGFAALSGMGFLRDVLREALRLYPPVPMMVRETTGRETFRKRTLPRGTQLVISPWHLHRNSRHWHDPDAFLPGRWADATTRAAQRAAYLPFSAGPRVCPGAGFAMAEAAVILAHVLEAFDLAPGPPPVPVAHLTVRARDGIRLTLTPRQT